MNKDLNTRLIDLTAGELLDLIQPVTQRADFVENFEHSDRYVYGIQGIATLLGVSKGTVHEYRNQGWIEPAIKQYGRKIVCDKEKALELFGKRK